MVKTDLYKSKKDLLLDFIKQHRYAKTSEIIKFGSDHFSNRADRDARKLASEGKIKRISKERKIRMFGPIKEDVWEVITFTNLPVTRLGSYVR